MGKAKVAEMFFDEAAKVRRRIEEEKQNTLSNSPNLNELIAGRNGIVNNKRAELENKLNNQPSMSALNQNESEKTVKSITDTIESATGASDRLRQRKSANNLIVWEFPLCG